jgi:hypothetical protein
MTTTTIQERKGTMTTSSRTHYLVSLLTLVAVLAAPLSVFAQSKKSADKDLDSEIESVRADWRADKVAIITDAMQFTPHDSSVFWPIYKKYEYDLSQLNDEQVKLIKSYAEKFSTLDDNDAKKLANDAFDLASRRVELRREYFGEFNKKLPATTVAKFFQLEHRFDLLVDLTVASELPTLLTKSPGHADRKAPSQ